MPPTIQSSGNERNNERRSRNANEKRSDMLIKVRYTNTLPDIPFEPKYLKYPFDPKRFVKYCPTSLEKNYKFDIITEHDLGVHIDLINPETYKIDDNAILDPADEKLLEDDSIPPVDNKRATRHAKAVPWLRRTEYISTEYNRYTQSSEKAESKIGFKIKKIMKDDDTYKDRESQVKAINQTFEAVKKSATVHYSKPNVHAVEELPLFPDFKLWRHPCAQVIFDSDPSPGGILPKHIQEELMAQAMIRGMMDESGNQFVAYFLPTEETLEQLKSDFVNDMDYTEGEDYTYKMAREYNWNVKNKLSKGYEENYFFVLRSDGAFYNELETRVRLSKRRLVQGQQSQVNRTKLAVKYRPFNDNEIRSQNVRLSQVLPPIAEDAETAGPSHTTTGNASDEGEGDQSPASAASGQDGDDHEDYAGSPRQTTTGAPHRRLSDNNYGDGRRRSSQSSHSSGGADGASPSDDGLTPHPSEVRVGTKEPPIDDEEEIFGSDDDYESE